MFGFAVAFASGFDESGAERAHSKTQAFYRGYRAGMFGLEWREGSGFDEGGTKAPHSKTPRADRGVNCV